MPAPINAANINQLLRQHLEQSTPDSIARPDMGGPVPDVARAAQGTVQNTTLERRTQADSFGRSASPIATLPEGTTAPAGGQGRVQGGGLVVGGQTVGGGPSLDARRAGVTTAKATLGQKSPEQKSLHDGVRKQLGDLLFKGQVSPGPLGESDLKALAGRLGSSAQKSPAKLNRAFEIKFNNALARSGGDMGQLRQQLIGR